MDVVKKIYQYAEPNLTLVGWMGLISFPLYYYVWTSIDPQPYESLELRSFCALLFAGIAFRHSFPKLLQRYFPYYYLFSIGVCLPFFFFFMMVMNNWSTEWTMSFMASIFLHILLVHETKVILIQALIASFVAYISAYFMMETFPRSIALWTYLPIFVFTYIFGNLFYCRNQTSHESKVSIAKSFGAGIAHEMRNPLSALKSSVDILRSLMPKYNSASEYILNAHDLSQIQEVLDHADEVIDSGSETIDLLLTSIDKNQVSTSTFKKQSAQSIVENAVQSFSYLRGSDKSAVSVAIEHEFDFLGSDTLLKFTLYNLLKNAFYYQNSENFHINIRVTRQDSRNLIIIKDNGVGIEPEQLDEIFKDFYTFGKNNSYGLGLPFCRRVMRSFGGSIHCRSVFGQWTEFILTFPNYSSERVNKIKLELMKSKVVLYIGEQETLFQHLNEKAFYQGFALHVMTIEQAIYCDKFEFDVILVNVDHRSVTWDKLRLLESKLYFTEAKISYLYNEENYCPVNASHYLTIYPMGIRQLLLDTESVMEQLFFEMENTNTQYSKPRDHHVNYSRQILITDDNDSLRMFSSLLLEKEGYKVFQAKDGQQALEILAKEKIDLVIMDIEMPIIDGLKTTNIIRRSNEKYKNLPIIGYTGDNRPETIKNIYCNGMNDYMVKPADKESLLSKISYWL